MWVLLKDFLEQVPFVVRSTAVMVVGEHRRPFHATGVWCIWKMKAKQPISVCVKTDRSLKPVRL